MGRELKRVPLDFKWPLNKVWEGFLNPHYTAVNCPACAGTGWSPYARKIAGQWYGFDPGTHEDVPFDPRSVGSEPYTADHPIIQKRAVRNCEQSGNLGYYLAEWKIQREAERLADLFNTFQHHLDQRDVEALVKRGRLMEFTHTWSPETRWQPKDPFVIPTAKEINEWSIDFGFGHDSINQFVVVKARCRRKRVGYRCKVCKGSARIWPSVEAERLYDEWEETAPPEGPGYQMWETVTEGSPISPVFDTPEALADWLVINRPQDGSFNAWMNMISGDGWAPSFVMTGGQIESGVEALARE